MIKRIFTRPTAWLIPCSILLVIACGASSDPDKRIIQIARDRLSQASSSEELVRYEKMLIGAVRCAHGDEAAIEEAKKLLGQAEQARPESDAELSAPKKMIAELEEAQAGYTRLVEEQRNIIAGNPDTRRGAQAALRIAMLTRAHKGPEEAVGAYQEILEGYPRTPEAFHAAAEAARIKEGSSGTDTANTSAPPRSSRERSRLDDGYDALSADRTDDAITIARELKTSSSPWIRGRALSLMMAATYRESGYEEAMDKAWAILTGKGGVEPVYPELDAAVAELTDRHETLQRGTAQRMKIIRDKPGTRDAAWAALEISDLTDRHGTRRDALASYRQVVADYPGTGMDFSARAAVARIYERAGETDAAKGVWSRAAAAFAESGLGEEAVQNLSRLYADEKAHAEGADALKKIAKSRPLTRTASSSMLAAGQLLHAKGDPDGALASYREALRHDPDGHGPTAVASIKGIWELDKQPEEVIGELEKLTILYPKTRAAARALLETAGIEEALGRPDRAAEAYEKLLADFPEGPNMPQRLWKLCDLQGKAGRFEDAVSTLERIEKEYLDSRVLDHNVMLDIANNCIHEKEYDAAIRIYELIRRISSDQIFWHFYTDDFIAYCLREKGDYEAAIERYQEMIEKYPTEAEWCAGARYKIGDIYLAQGKTQEALDELQKVLDEYPDSHWKEGTAMYIEDIKREMKR